MRGLWYSYSCSREQTVELTFELPVVWDAIVLISITVKGALNTSFSVWKPFNWTTILYAWYYYKPSISVHRIQHPSYRLSSACRYHGCFRYAWFNYRMLASARILKQILLRRRISKEYRSPTSPPYQRRKVDYKCPEKKPLKLILQIVDVAYIVSYCVEMAEWSTREWCDGIHIYCMCNSWIRVNVVNVSEYIYVYTAYIYIYVASEMYVNVTVHVD